MHLEIYGSFELQPVLGNGKPLRKLTITVEQLLDHSVQCIREWMDALCSKLDPHVTAAFAPSQENEDVVLPCPSLSITARRQKRKNNDPWVLSSRRVSGRIASTSPIDQRPVTH